MKKGGGRGDLAALDLTFHAAKIRFRWLLPSRFAIRPALQRSARRPYPSAGEAFIRLSIDPAKPSKKDDLEGIRLR